MTLVRCAAAAAAIGVRRRVRGANRRLCHPASRLDPARPGLGDRQGGAGQLQAAGPRHRIRRRRPDPRRRQHAEGGFPAPRRRRAGRSAARRRQLERPGETEPAQRHDPLRLPDGLLGAQGRAYQQHRRSQGQARALRVGSADERHPPHDRVPQRRRHRLERCAAHPGGERGARGRRLQGRKARSALLRGGRAQGAGSRRLGGRPARSCPPTRCPIRSSA